MATPQSQLETTPSESVVTAANYQRVRDHSLALAEPLSAEDSCVQSMPDASPAKWHLAHVTWFFETFVLEKAETDFRPHHPAFRELFNSYYNGIGKQFSRPDRGMITRPGLAEILAYRAAIDERMQAVIARADAETLATIELGLHHEQQHQELLLMDIKHLLSLNPLNPAYAPAPPAASASAPPTTDDWFDVAGGTHEIGHDGTTFCYDNETPRHRTLAEPFRIARRLVTNGEYLQFIEDGGYRSPLLWLADGWATINTQDWQAPLYWRRIDGAWHEFTLHGLLPLDPARPVCHVSYFEADAYAQWCSRRLPTEQEWEISAALAPDPDTDGQTLHPGAATADATAGAAGLSQLCDAVWQWTRSAYLPYPGFSPASGAVGEYNGKFMLNQMTLRGGACITPAHHARITYRNFFYPHQRWAFSGLRLAADA